MITCFLCGRALPRTRSWFAYVEAAPAVWRRVCDRECIHESPVWPPDRELVTTPGARGRFQIHLPQGSDQYQLFEAE